MGHIYWIASYPKSGNTWMRSFLARLILGEDGSIDKLRGFAPDENFGIFYQPLLSRPMAETSVEEVARIRPAAQARIASAVNGFQFLKTHMMYARHAGTPTINAAVTAGAIYVVRNPLDIVVSYSAFRQKSFDTVIDWLNEKGRFLPRAEKHAYVVCGSWTEHVTSWTSKPHDRLLVLRYEDMLAEPVQEFTRVAKFIGLNAKEGAVAEACEGTSFERLQAAEDEHGFQERPDKTERFFRRGEADQWREELSPGQIAAVVRPNRDAMKAMGYWLDEFDQL
jgi:hypothetical protein